MKNFEANSNMEYSDNSPEEKNEDKILDEHFEKKSETRDEKLVYDYLNISAEKRNFEIDIRINSDNDRTTISLVKENGELNDFSGYIPKGYKLVPADRFECDRVGKKIYFNTQQVNKRSFLLSLAHELGHSRCDKITNIYNFNFFKRLGFLLINQIKESIQIRKKMEGLSNKEKRLIIRNELNSRSVESFIPLEYIERESEESAMSERNAWADSLNILRQLDKEGFSVFDDFESVEEIRAYIAYCLFSHEIAAQHEQKISLGGEKQEEYKMHFLRQKDLSALKKYVKK